MLLCFTKTMLPASQLLPGILAAASASLQLCWARPVAQGTSSHLRCLVAGKLNLGLATCRPCQLLPSSSSGRRLRPEPVCEQATIDLHEGRHVQDHRLLRPALWREPLGCVGPTAGCEQHTAHEHRTHEREARLCVGISLSTIFAATASDMVDPPASSTVTSLPGRVSSDSV